MKNRIACVSLVLCLICVFLLGCATAGEIVPYENPIFDSAGLTLSSNMDVVFLAGTRRNCSSIYVSSCTLEKRNSNGTWSHETSLTPPSDVAYNTSDFAAQKNYASSCDEGNTYRVVVVFSAIYNGTEYTVDRTSRSVTYK